MNKLLKGILFGVLIEATAVAVIWSAIELQGSRWAALFALGVVPLLLFRFPEKQKGRH